MADLRQAFTGKKLDVFVSYAREDAAALGTVEDGLRMLNHEVWIDKQLKGGQDWWDLILQRIRECDVMIVAVSPALLESEAASKEREYARRLGKPLLPVQIDPVLPELLPPDIAGLQIVDYTNLGPMTGFQLAAALAAVPVAPPLPEPLPEAPARPMPPLAELAQRLSAAQLSLDDQLALVASLRVALDRAREQAAALELLRALRRRRDLYHATWQELDELMQRERAIRQDEQDVSTATDHQREKNDAPAAEPATVPPGWYSDPSGRHRLRWYDGDWTAYASDDGKVIEDADF